LQPKCKLLIIKQNQTTSEIVNDSGAAKIKIFSDTYAIYDKKIYLCSGIKPILIRQQK